MEGWPRWVNHAGSGFEAKTEVTTMSDIVVVVLVVPDPIIAWR